ncbi:MAG: protoheme IX farnesyltransferase [Bacteroidetes bacterium]|nr:protoheme IX farnesyltransferase [Bacteroidota bacterium]
MRLTSLVVFSSAMGYLMGANGKILWGHFILLLLGGFLITGSANALNQILERDTDKLMSRTAKRPLPSNRLGMDEASIFALLLGVTGIFILGYFINPLSAVLGIIALILYAFVYTPMKKKSSAAVFVGAFPGAIPVLIGWVAATNNLGITAWMLFGIQFIWQFPHTWAIAWVLEDDYKKAGIQLLPSAKGRGKSSAFHAIIYTLLLIPISLLPAKFGYTGIYSAIILVAVGGFFLYQAINLYRKCDLKSARMLMLGSFVYLPVALIALVLDKTW